MADPPARSARWKPVAFALLVVVIAGLGFAFRNELSLAALAERESQLRAFQSDHPIAVYVAAFTFYVMITGLSLPGAAALTLVYGWYFGFAGALVLISFASTLGATLAFLSSRYLLRDAVQAKYGEAMRRFENRLQAEGPFYLFTLRLIPAVPFFVINLVMGLTPIGVWTFWWISQIGMLAGTVMYVYAGSSVPSLDVLAAEGIRAVFQPAQIAQLTIALVALGAFPLIARWTVSRWRSKR